MNLDEIMRTGACGCACADTSSHKQNSLAGFIFCFFHLRWKKSCRQAFVLLKIHLIMYGAGLTDEKMKKKKNLQQQQQKTNKSKKRKQRLQCFSLCYILHPPNTAAQIPPVSLHKGDLRIGWWKFFSRGTLRVEECITGRSNVGTRMMPNFLYSWAHNPLSSPFSHKSPTWEWLSHFVLLSCVKSVIIIKEYFQIKAWQI